MRRFMDASIASFLENSCADCSSGYEGLFVRTQNESEGRVGAGTRASISATGGCQLLAPFSDNSFVDAGRDAAMGMELHRKRSLTLCQTAEISCISE